MTAAQARKAIAVAALGLAQLAAYIIADPTNLPPWVVAAAGIINTLAVFWVRNDPPAQHGPRAAGLADQPPRPPSRPLE
jgi:hypothetical protein